MWCADFASRQAKRTTKAEARIDLPGPGRLARHHVDGKSGAGGLRAIRPRIASGVELGLDDTVERPAVRAAALESELGGVHGLHHTHGTALDAGDLAQAARTEGIRLRRVVPTSTPRSGNRRNHSRQSASLGKPRQ